MRISFRFESWVYGIHEFIFIPLTRKRMQHDGSFPTTPTKELKNKRQCEMDHGFTTSQIKRYQKNIKHIIHFWFHGWNGSMIPSNISTLFSPTQFNQPFQKLLSWFCKASTLVSVTVSWSVPFDSGGLPVLGYKAPGSLSVGGNKACSLIDFCSRYVVYLCITSTY